MQLTWRERIGRASTDMNNPNQTDEGSQNKELNGNPVYRSTCRFIKADGRFCRRTVPLGHRRCWQHAKGLKQKWSALARSAQVGFLLALVSLTLTAFGTYLSWKQSSPKEGNSGINTSTRNIINEMLTEFESTSSQKSFMDDQDELSSSLNAELKKDPYNIRALLIRGQTYYTAAKTGSKGLREALVDFEQAAKIDAKIGDPHFGIGTVLYQLAIFDLVHRGLFQIHRKGKIILDKKTGLPKTLPPDLEIFPDVRNKVVLQAALEEFEKGHTLQQLYNQSGQGTITFFDPESVENRIRTLRELLQYSPSSGYADQELVFTLALYFSRENPKAMLEIFDIEGREAPMPSLHKK
jgi:hypothetical protein